jgi:hypothetical protein
MATTKTIGIDWHGLAVRPTAQYTSDAAIAGAIVRDVPCVLAGFIATNANAATRFIQVHDSKTVPADGAVPLMSFKIAAGEQYVLSEVPLPLSNGLYICLSTTQNTKTLAGADMVLLAYTRP